LFDGVGEVKGRGRGEGVRIQATGDANRTTCIMRKRIRDKDGEMRDKMGRDGGDGECALGVVVVVVVVVAAIAASVFVFC
jgi:hypothetical protein